MPITMEPHSGPSLVGMLKDAWEAMKAPGKAYNEGMTPDEMIKAANDFAMTVGAGGSLVPKPGNSLGMFGGKLAKTANLEKLAKAEQFEKAGVDPDTIWKSTGWGRGVDGHWRFEIDDTGAKLTQAAKDYLKNAGPEDNQSFTAESGFMHPKLYEAYPQLRNLKVQPETQEGVLGSSHNGMVKLQGKTNFPMKMDSTMLHELQHEVQNIEGFAKGNSYAEPEYAIVKALDHAIQQAPTFEEKKKINDLLVRAAMATRARKNLLYKNSAGEVEARTVQNRMYMNKLRRAIRSPWADEDVPRQSQLVFGHKAD
jgi:hypothetical protein